MSDAVAVTEAPAGDFMDKVNSFLEGGEITPPAEYSDPTPAPEPVEDSTISDAPDTQTEPTEPAEETPAVDTAEGEQPEQASVTLSAEEVVALNEHLAMMESYLKNGGVPAPIAPPENAPELAAQAEAAEAAATQAVAEWQPMTPQEAEEMGIYPEAAEIQTRREMALARTLAQAVDARLGQFAAEIQPIINEANERAEVSVMTYLALQSNPEFNEVIPQLRNEIKRARAANPSATPDKIFDAAKKEMSKHVAGFSALQRLRGVQVANAGKPASSAPSTARATAEVKRPLSFQEKLEAIQKKHNLI